MERALTTGRVSPECRTKFGLDSEEFPLNDAAQMLLTVGRGAVRLLGECRKQVELMGAAELVAFDLHRSTMEKLGYFKDLAAKRNAGAPVAREEPPVIN
jgi:hypothetical protein